MKKITKLSLVAAVAVAGLTSASAKPLEEAIKNVDVSGTVTYRYDNFGNDESGQTHNVNKYKINLNLSSKVNDYVKFNARANFSDVEDFTNDFASLDKEKNSSDANPSLDLSQAYFGFTGIANTTVNVGKQGLATPWTVATDNQGNEQTGTGIFSVTAIDKFVVGLAYFNQTNINTSELKTKDQFGNKIDIFDGSKDIYAATLQANYGFVNAEAWYLNAVDQFDTYTLAVHGKLDLAESAKLGYEVRYVSLDAGDINSSLDKNSLLRFAVNGKFGIVNAKLAYSMTDKDGGITALDKDSQNASLGWRLDTLGKADAKFLQATVGMDLIDDLNLSLNYNNLEYKADAEVKQNGVKKDPKQSEVFAQLTYKMSKNLDGYIRYGQQDMDRADGSKENSGRLQVNYRF
ncbi:major outer membrane protein [Arcobacter porcinus]|uniref:Major outer membrane protein n=1 Tax=Arcobacter porcinus TaxID=1935204 RepID=A0ABX2YA91_9BACT|nr:major outer membrane protein [Arcobacter porcinus]OCL89740.1 Major outer membrane protein precursor [Arcobacter porcinus]